MVSKIPKGSAVVFIFGEIDCREGILVAVEKLRYKTPQEGAEHTAGIFIKVTTPKQSGKMRGGVGGCTHGRSCLTGGGGWCGGTVKCLFDGLNFGSVFFEVTHLGQHG